jgi:heme/copper-type cytochrome/quinol oxidase subunit 2
MSCGEAAPITDFSPDYSKLDEPCGKKTFHHGGCEDKKVCPKPAPKECGSWASSYWFSFILGFIILAVIIALLLAAAKPTWVQNTDADGQPDGTVNAGKVILWAVIVSLFVIFIIWIVLALLWGAASTA